MAFTDNCDLYGAFHEDGVNRIIQHMMRQRPSLFNYATANIAANRELWCSKIGATGDVTKHGNPLFTIMDPLPLLGADAPLVSIGFIAQLTRAEIDFHKSNVINLPAELGPPLKEQRFALYLRGCAAIGCPPQQLIDRIPVTRTDSATGGERNPKDPTIVLPGETNCVCLDIFVVGHVERQFIAGREAILAKVDEMDIVDIKPEALEENLICYLMTTVNVVLREKLTIALQTLMLSFPLFGLATVTLAPTPNPPVPHNPAIEDDQLKAFITMTVI
jgi:hypothetical protein